MRDVREKLDAIGSSAVPTGGPATGFAALNAWAACALLPGLPAGIPGWKLALSALGVVPALVAALRPPEGHRPALVLRLAIGPMGLLGAVLALDATAGLALDAPRAFAAAASFGVYLALALATKDRIPPVEVLREDPHGDRGGGEPGRRARRRALLFAGLATSAFALVVVAPFVGGSALRSARWGAASEEGHVLTLLFGLSLALLVTLGILAPTLRKQREADRSPAARLVLATGLALAAGLFAWLGVAS